jgi:tRNA (adenine22-N1)-methyltransferase
MADVGTDHAQLPAFLVGTGRVPRAIAIDVIPGPLAWARRTLAQMPEVEVELRMGNGLEPLAPGEVATVVLAGMGGMTMRGILDAGDAVVQRLGRLVLQPNTQWPDVRAWIDHKGFELVDEQIVEDAAKFYVILVVEPVRSRARPSWTQVDLELGPILRHRGGAVFHAWVEDRKRRLTRALQRARSNDALASVRELEAQLGRLGGAWATVSKPATATP